MKLTPGQLRQNAAAMIALANNKPIQFRHHGSTAWVDCMSGFNDIAQPHWEFDIGEYRPKPEPKTRPWNCPQDVPGPVCWIRSDDLTSLEVMIVSISNIGIHLFTGGVIKSVDWDRLGELVGKHGYKYSTDRKTWQPCFTLEDAKP